MVIRDDIEQSEHWDERQGLPLLETGFHDCWPCQEGFPDFPWYGMQALFEIVTVWGLRTEAWIDDAREYSAEGLEWTIYEGPGKSRAKNVPEIRVACWRRIPDRSIPR